MGSEENDRAKLLVQKKRVMLSPLLKKGGPIGKSYKQLRTSLKVQVKKLNEP